MPHHPHGIEAANRIMEQDTHSSGGGRPEREPVVGERATRPDRCEPAVWARGAGVTYVRKLGLAGPRTEPRDQTISGEGDVRGRRRDPEECEQTAEPRLEREREQLDLGPLATRPFDGSGHERGSNGVRVVLGP